MPVDASRCCSFGESEPACGDARQIAFDVGEKHRHAALREVIGEELEADGLAGPRGAGDEAVAVAHGRNELELGAVGGFCDDEWFDHDAAILGEPVSSPRIVANCAG